MKKASENISSMSRSKIPILDRRNSLKCIFHVIPPSKILPIHNRSIRSHTITPHCQLINNFHSILQEKHPNTQNLQKIESAEEDLKRLESISAKNSSIRETWLSIEEKIIEITTQRKLKPIVEANRIPLSSLVHPKEKDNRIH